MSLAFSLAGFEVTLSGRFWVTPEGRRALWKQMRRDALEAAHHTCEVCSFAWSPIYGDPRHFSTEGSGKCGGNMTNLWRSFFNKFPKQRRRKRLKNFFD
jgi:hypothetical protein